MGGRAVANKGKEIILVRRVAHQVLAGICVLMTAALVARADDIVVAEQPTTQPAQKAPAIKSDAMVGKPAPDFDLRGTVLGAKRLSDLRGEAVVVIFHGEYCPPSRKALQCLADVNRQSSAPFQLIVANSWDTPEKAKAEMDSLHISPAVVCDEKLVELYQIDVIPLIVFIGADGKVTRTFLGFEGESMAAKFSESAMEAHYSYKK